MLDEGIYSFVFATDEHLVSQSLADQSRARFIQRSLMRLPVLHDIVARDAKRGAEFLRSGSGH